MHNQNCCVESLGVCFLTTTIELVQQAHAFADNPCVKQILNFLFSEDIVLED